MTNLKIRKRSFAGLILALTVLLASCSSGPKTVEITLVAEDIVWDQNEIEVQVGQTVNLTLRNDGTLDHTFVLKALDLDVPLSPGEEKIVSFVVSEAATLSYICDVPGHEEAGMAGEFIVSE